MDERLNAIKSILRGLGVTVVIPGLLAKTPEWAAWRPNLPAYKVVAAYLLDLYLHLLEQD